LIWLKFWSASKFGRSEKRGASSNHFELREYDPIIGRWTSKDPAGQYYSPYVGMGNNPVSGTDPDGGKVSDWVRNNSTGEYSWDAKAVSQSTTQKGFTYIGPSIANVFNHFDMSRMGFDHWLKTENIPNINLAGWPGEFSDPTNLFGKIENFTKEDGSGVSGWAYKTVDEAYLTLFQVGKDREHLNGTGAYPSEITDAGVGTLTNLLPQMRSGLFLKGQNKILNASEFSSLYKGSPMLKGPKTDVGRRVVVHNNETRNRSAVKRVVDAVFNWLTF
jgi:RHS repeat-associated protein